MNISKSSILECGTSVFSISLFFNSILKDFLHINIWIIKIEKKIMKDLDCYKFCVKMSKKFDQRYVSIYKLSVRSIKPQFLNWCQNFPVQVKLLSLQHMFL